MIGKIFYTFAEKFQRKRIQRYCWECGKAITGQGLTLWCGRRCKAKTTARGSAAGVGALYHKAGGGQ